jgi:hypothetical protein
MVSVIKLIFVLLTKGTMRPLRFGWQDCLLDDPDEKQGHAGVDH